MKKGLAIALFTGVLCGALVSQSPSQAGPVSKDLTKQPIAQLSQNPTRPVKKDIAQQQNGWKLPKISSNDNYKSAVTPVEGDDGKPVIQVALLLDTSGSMSPLIDQAKTELWSIVNKLDKARYKGKKPKIEVALYEYGKSSLARDEGYIRQLAPFTYDLDGLSETLFALKTNGGDEYCAWAIRSAIDSLKWKKRKGSLRMLFVAGNESFNQGPVETGPILKEATDQGILVHPVYCSNGNQRDRVSWDTAADLAQTDLKVIDHTRVARIPRTPYDKRINDLNIRLNGTYVGYGRSGQAKRIRQRKQDSNASVLSPSAAAERAVTKSSANYRNESWDLVDKSEAAGGVGNIAEDQLPAELKELSKSEREEFVAKKAQERKEIQNEIKTLSKDRQAFLDKKREEAPGGSQETLGGAVIKTVKVKARSQGFTVE